jgi:CheY-like chemotaxis protein
VADREAAQERSQQAADRLSRTLEELSRVQQQVVRSEKLRAEAQMASGIAHDLSNTLQVILGVSEGLLARPADELDRERVRGDLEMIAQASRDAAGVVSRLRRVHHYGRRGRFRSVDLAALAAQAVAAAEPRLRQRSHRGGGRIEIVREIADGLATYGDEGELREALGHLIENAIEAMPDGGRLSLTGRRRAGRAVLEVTDEGTGMDDETRLRSGEPFFSTKGGRGSGLGLTLVQGAVALHSGSLEIDSSPAAGTTVRILLPLGSGQSRPRNGGVEASSDPLSILLVDDEEPVRRTMTAFLELDRHKVSAAADGVAAAELVERQRFDLVLTDLDMPRIDGVELAAFLARRSPETAVIMMTGLAALDQRGEALPEGVDRMLPKPVGLAELRRAISEIRSRPE